MAGAPPHPRVRRWAWALCGGLALAGAAIAVATLVPERRPEWTASSPEALAAFEAGEIALSKVYAVEARRCFEKALELEPSFVAAKVFLLPLLDSAEMGRAQKLAEQLRQQPLERLTPRERFLTRYQLAGFERDAEAAEKALREFALLEPDDRFVLSALAQRAIARQQWSRAEELLERLIRRWPNQVRPYNDLGYLAMAQGRFAESERMFCTYRYIAPDQANPHDSLGELFLLLGRYAEARQALESAIAVRPDFCPAHLHLARLAELEGDLEAADAVIARAEASGGCAPASLGEARCGVAQWRAYEERDWEQVWLSGEGGCAKAAASRSLVRYHAALATGRLAWADSFAEQVRVAGHNPTARVPRAMAAHMEGAAMLAAGEAAAAVEKLRAADAELSYRSLEEGLPKLLNRLVLARALVAVGAVREAVELEAAVAAVNPRFGERFALLAERAAR